MGIIPKLMEYPPLSMADVHGPAWAVQATCPGWAAQHGPPLHLQFAEKNIGNMGMGQNIW